MFGSRENGRKSERKKEKKENLYEEKQKRKIQITSWKHK